MLVLISFVVNKSEFVDSTTFWFEYDKELEGKKFIVNGEHVDFLTKQVWKKDGTVVLVAHVNTIKAKFTVGE